MDRLTPISPGVVHSSPYRTRLKTAKWKHASESDVALVKDALEKVPGVTEVRPMAQGYVIHHEPRADVVENIGTALSQVSPVLLEHLTADPRQAHKHKNGGKSAAESLLDRLNLDRFDFSTFNFSLANAPQSLEEAQPLIKKSVPAILAGAGALMLLEGESILAGVGPLALFYWAFDYNWKMKQERMQKQVINEVDRVEHFLE